MADLASSLPPLHAVVVVWEPGDDTPVRVLPTNLDELTPTQTVGLLRAAAMRLARQHGLNGRDCLDLFLSENPQLNEGTEE